MQTGKFCPTGMPEKTEGTSKQQVKQAWSNTGTGTFVSYTVVTQATGRGQIVTPRPRLVRESEKLL